MVGTFIKILFSCCCLVILKSEVALTIPTPFVLFVEIISKVSFKLLSFDKISILSTAPPLRLALPEINGLLIPITFGPFA